MKKPHNYKESDNLYPYITLTNIDKQNNSKIYFAIEICGYFLDEIHEKGKIIKDDNKPANAF